MRLPEHPRINPLTVKTVLAGQRARVGSEIETKACGTVFATPDQLVQACLALMEANAIERIAVVDNGKVLGVLGIAELQKALIVHYESIFAAIALDQRLLFMQGVYSC